MIKSPTHIQMYDFHLHWLDSTYCLSIHLYENESIVFHFLSHLLSPSLLVRELQDIQFAADFFLQCFFLRLIF